MARSPKGVAYPSRSWERIEGCRFSGSIPCKECPFKECYWLLTKSKQIQFSKDFKENGAKDWLRNGDDNGNDNVMPLFWQLYEEIVK